MKLEFHYTYLLVALSFVLTGYFSNLLVFTSIIIIHELGHYIVAKLNKLNVEKIIIYPYGGITKMNNLINAPINKELQVAVSGIFFQTIYYIVIILLYKENIIRDYIFNLFNKYHTSILIFNLLPIHPLDGSKILNLVLSKYLPYKLTQKLNVIISVITVIIFLIINYYQFNYTTILIITVIIDNTLKYNKEINYTYNRFLLERYLYNLNYQNKKTIKKIDNMCKEKTHIIKEKNRYITEKQALKHRFRGKI